MRYLVFTAFASLLVSLSAPTAAAQTSSDAGAFEAASREIVDSNWASYAQDGSGATVPNQSVGAIARRAQEGLYSLLLPGWSQYRQGHRTRAALFAGAEAAVWTSWLVYRIQGERREDAYGEFAVQFADVNGSEHDEAYWKAVASFQSSDLNNADVRVDLRSSGESDGSLYGGSQSWAWRSDARFREFQRLRADSLSAFDHAETVLVFALLTRAVAFVDAVRSAGADDEDPFGIDAGGFRFGVDVDTSLTNPGARFGVGRGF